MTKDFEARAKQREAFETEWEFQQGSLMLKNVNEGKEWKRVVADWFFQQGARYGREAGLELAAGIISTELQDLEEAEFMERDKERINIRAWLMNARACIRAAKEKKGTSE